MGRGYDRRMQYLGLILLVLIVLAMAFLLVKDYVETRDYVQVDAILEDVSTEYGTGSKSNMMQFKYAKFSFTYEGKKWEARRPTFFASSRNVGKLVKIKCDPSDPTVLENTAFWGAELVLLLLSILSILAVKKSMY